ncbi:MAG TPA: sulfur transferase domain-containing protein [Woeseiaceae bacterium]|nr:sulfur transferase domain-containing protein [Woeseiaceae bacterium]
MIGLVRSLLLIGSAAVLAACADDDTRYSGPVAYLDVAEVSAGAEPRPVGGLTAAGQPDEAAFEAFAEAGYVAVVDMRAPDEDRGLEDEQGLVEALGLDYIAFPIASEEEIDFESAARLDALLESYDGPVLVHCASSNRVGALLALRESLRGADDDTALGYGRAAGLTRLEPRVKEVLEERK